MSGMFEHLGKNIIFACVGAVVAVGVKENPEAAAAV